MEEGVSGTAVDWAGKEGIRGCAVRLQPWDLQRRPKKRRGRAMGGQEVLGFGLGWESRGEERIGLAPPFPPSPAHLTGRVVMEGDGARWRPRVDEEGGVDYRG
jgi:hypothetical protein